MNLIKVIITKDCVYATHNQTVIFEKKFEKTDDFLDRVSCGDDLITPIINKAMCIAYDHACGLNNLILCREVKDELMSIEDVFNYIETKEEA